MLLNTTSAMACVIITSRVIDTFIPLTSKEEEYVTKQMGLKNNDLFLNVCYNVKIALPSQLIKEPLVRKTLLLVLLRSHRTEPILDGRIASDVRIALKNGLISFLLYTLLLWRLLQYETYIWWDSLFPMWICENLLL